MTNHMHREKKLVGYLLVEQLFFLEQLDWYSISLTETFGFNLGFNDLILH